MHFIKLLSKICLLCFLLLIISCSGDDSSATDVGETPIVALEYGYSVRGNGSDPNISYSYKLFDKQSGKIFHSGNVENGDAYNWELFDITEEELNLNEISIEIKIMSTITGYIGNYFHVYRREGDVLYILDWDQNPNAATPFTVNELVYNSELDVYEGTYPLRASEIYWYANGLDDWEDYRNN